MAEIVVCRDLEDLSRRAATEFVRLALKSVRSKDRFTVALSGGATPRALYSLLATAEFREKIAWPKIHLFGGTSAVCPRTIATAITACPMKR